MDLLKTSSVIKKYNRQLWLAIHHHKTHKNRHITFDGRQYLVDLYKDNSQKIVVMKSTQCGVSEYLINYSFAKADIGWSVLYVLPIHTLMLTFVQNRVNKTISYSKYHQDRMNATGDAKSVWLKHFGDGVIKFIGSNTPNAFIEFPADEVIIDELDKCNQDNLEMSVERMSGSEIQFEKKVSNPTIDEFGIDSEYQKSDKKKWHIKCPHCNNWFIPDFFGNVVEKINDTDYRVISSNNDNSVNFVCNKCKKIIDRYTGGEWVAEKPNRDISGYHINKLFSGFMPIKSLVDRFEKGLKDSVAMQRFYNGDLGLPYTADSTSIPIGVIDSCIDKEYTMPISAKVSYPAVMGVDVGTRFHIRVSQIMPDGRLRASYIGSCYDWEDVVNIARMYNARVGVVDALPETRISRKICSVMRGFFMCYFENTKNDKIDYRHRSISVERTRTLDAVKDMFVDNKIILPNNARNIPEYYDHLLAVKRVLVTSNIVGVENHRYVWINNDKPDHFFLAEAYSLLAYRLRSSLVGRGGTR